MTCDLIYQRHRALDQMKRTQEIVRDNKTWLTRCQCDRMEWCMKRTVHALERSRRQIRYKCAEGNLVDAWTTWWAQNRHEPSYTEVDRQIDKMSDEIIRGKKSRGLIINVDEKDTQALKKFVRMP